MTDVNEIARLVEQYQLWLKDKTTLKSVHADWVKYPHRFSTVAMTLSSSTLGATLAAIRSRMTATLFGTWSCRAAI